MRIRSYKRQKFYGGFFKTKVIIEVLYQITNDMAECDKNKKEKKMKRNLLFISRYPEIIDEFQGILEEKQIETDIAQNGTDAMELLKQKNIRYLSQI